MGRASISAALALVDLSGIAVDRSDEVARYVALAVEAALPTILVGAIDGEASRFGLVVASLPTNVRVEELIAAVRVRT